MPPQAYPLHWHHGQMQGFYQSYDQDKYCLKKQMDDCWETMVSVWVAELTSSFLQAWDEKIMCNRTINEKNTLQILLYCLDSSSTSIPLSGIKINRFLVFVKGWAGAVNGPGCREQEPVIQKGIIVPQHIVGVLVLVLNRFTLHQHQHQHCLTPNWPRKCCKSFLRPLSVPES